jgi:hypothetical protein
MSSWREHLELIILDSPTTDRSFCFNVFFTGAKPVHLFRFRIKVLLS